MIFRFKGMIMKILGKFHIQIHKNRTFIGNTHGINKYRSTKFLLYKNFDIYDSLEKVYRFLG